MPKKSFERPYAISTLEERHMISILLFLRDKDIVKKCDIYDAISRNPRMPDKLDVLEASGLITQEMDAGGLQRMHISLTDVGRNVAEMLWKIEGSMSGIYGKGSD